MAKKKKTRTSQSYKSSVGVPLGTTLQVPRVIIRSIGRRTVTKYAPTAPTFKRIALEKYQALVRARYLPAKQAVRARPTRAPPTLKQSLAAINPLKVISSVIPRPGVCIKRVIRREVLHALGKTGSGAPRHKSSYKKDETSKVKC